eukprot:350329-Chlamydomonas_euryale.AAC.2
MGPMRTGAVQRWQRQGKEQGVRPTWLVGGNRRLGRRGSASSVNARTASREQQLQPNVKHNA